MVKITVEGDRREVYAMSFDILAARSPSGELLFGELEEQKEESTFREEDPLDVMGKLVFHTHKYERER